ncbi:MAG TPA: cytidine deaminase [Rhodopseudomonas sp.]|uniref:cytidine deaminase n=1 Tax=Rhodopseudomonas sp. TaxID=1078 RepID=UPI002EDBB16F
MIKPRHFAELSDPDRRLIDSARGVSANAYAPYSGFAVGAAVRTKSGKIFTGANLENASYGLGMCAEVAAITAANSANGYDIEAIAVVGHKFTPPRDASQVVTPCGRCRQLIFEASQVAGVDVRVFSCSGDLAQIHEAAISELLPDAFGPQNLGLETVWPQIRAALIGSVAEWQEPAAPPADPVFVAK